MPLLKEIAESLSALSDDERAVIIKQTQEALAGKFFTPLPGPQTEAYLSDADVLLYGGQAGGGKSFLMMGLAAQEHRRSMIFRRESSQTDGLQEAGKEIIGDRARFNGSDAGEWNWPDGRNLKLAGIKEPGDWNKHAGRERDMFGFDEAGEFLREQVASLMAWNRGPEGQRCRIVLASNPPRSSDGAWLKEWFSPWLDLNQPNCAVPGELRWAIMVDMGDGLTPHWVEGPGEYEYGGETRQSISFTYIPAKLEDNPFRDTPEYRARLDSLPEPLRSQLKFGDWTAGQTDNLNQIIPSEWVREAMARWEANRPVGVPQCAIGVDVAQGGLDNTVCAARYDAWFDQLTVFPGKDTPDGVSAAGKVLTIRRNNSVVVVDVGGGWGADAFGHLKGNQIDAVPYMGVKDSVQRTKDNLLKFNNIRTEAIWRFREALDPTQDGGSSVCLPPDQMLMADLTAITYEVKSGKGGMTIHAYPKDKLVKDLGRSTDRGDAVIMSWYAGAKWLTHGEEWRKVAGRATRSHRAVKVVTKRPKRR